MLTNDAAQLMELGPEHRATRVPKHAVSPTTVLLLRDSWSPPPLTVCVFLLQTPASSIQGFPSSTTLSR